MSDSRKYLLGATATVVAARIAARATLLAAGKASATEPRLATEFAETYRELEAALEQAMSSSAQEPYAKKDKKREDENLKGD